MHVIGAPSGQSMRNSMAADSSKDDRFGQPLACDGFLWQSGAVNKCLGQGRDEAMPERVKTDSRYFDFQVFLFRYFSLNQAPGFLPCLSAFAGLMSYRFAAPFAFWVFT